MILFGKRNIAVIIITMLGIFSKKMAHIEILSNSYTNRDCGLIKPPM
jgi:hypothetical protein